jgi:hypothetical protein
VNGPGVGDLLLGGGGRGQLDEFAKPCPVLANSQLGNSMVNASRAALACSSCRVVIIGIPRVQRFCQA